MADPIAELGLAAAELAHELRNVFATIATSAHAAKRNPAETSKLLDRIGHVSQTGQRLVEDVLALAREPELHRERVSLADLLHTSRITLEHPATFVDAGEDVEVTVDLVLFARVLHALYANAAALGAAGAPVCIETRAHTAADGSVTIEVEDNGPGVPEALRERLFQPFATARKGGTGLGLALATRIVDAHGGRLTLLEERASTTFCIALPAP